MKKKTLLAASSLLQAKLFRKRIPLIIGWAITNRCNSQCLYCTRWKNAGNELNTSSALSVIDELSRLGTYSINFTGGEALIRDDIGEVINYAKGKGIRVRLSSNGLLVACKIQAIKKIDSLMLSFDGEQGLNDYQRCNGSYANVLNAISAAKENNIPVGLYTVLTKNNIETIDFILDFAAVQEVAVNFSVVEFEPYSEEESISKLLPSPQKMNWAIQKMVDRKRNGSLNIGNSLPGLIYLLHWPDHDKVNCCAGKIYCRIEPNGDVYPCANLISKVKPYNCMHAGFGSAFAKLQPSNCSSCWGDARFEMNSIYSFNPKSIIELLKAHKL